MPVAGMERSQAVSSANPEQPGQATLCSLGASRALLGCGRRRGPARCQPIVGQKSSHFFLALPLPVLAAFLRQGGLSWQKPGVWE